MLGLFFCAFGPKAAETSGLTAVVTSWITSLQTSTDHVKPVQGTIIIDLHDKSETKPKSSQESAEISERSPKVCANQLHVTSNAAG